jgi:hypothetical protein
LQKSTFFFSHKKIPTTVPLRKGGTKGGCKSLPSTTQTTPDLYLLVTAARRYPPLYFSLPKKLFEEKGDYS